MLNNLLPILIVLSALIPGLLIFLISENDVKKRRILNFAGNISCLLLISLLIRGVYNGETFETRLPLLPDIDLVLHADALSLLFVSLSGVLWLLTTVYAIGYLEGTENRSRFFGFFSLCVAATLGIALSGNLITFLIFYELLTLTTYPLVVHKGNTASLRAGRTYLIYTMVGGALLLGGVVWLKAIAGPLDFTTTGILSAMPQLDPFQLKLIFALLISGLGVKAALFPFHGWLPVAMAAPAPVSALLHAVAVVKAGAFGIVRVVYDVYGIEFARDLGLTVVLAGFAGFTIVYGSLVALRQNDIKKRLAYSTVSQVSYIALGTAIAGPIATIGGIVHLFHQGVMKITLFFCAGNLAETLHVHKVSELNGVGRRMPLTMTAFSIAALGMIGLPPLAGFVSKWYLGSGAIEVGAYWVLGILAISSFLNALYFLPILHAAWFKPSDKPWPAKKGTLETNWLLLLPPVITSTLAVITGLFASASFSPLSWVELIAALEYGREWAIAVPHAINPFTNLLWVIITPAILAVGMFSSLTRSLFIQLLPIAALPALITALVAEPGSYVVSGLFFDSVLVINQGSQTMLLLASLLWMIAAIYGLHYLAHDKHIQRYCTYFLVCMSGSFGLTLSHDLFGFISFFTVMSFAAYGLVVHSETTEAISAGKRYIQWVVVGEVILFAAFIGITSYNVDNTQLTFNRSTQDLWVNWFLIIGFGIKAGLLGTHFWLPRAHPVAPVPASALLSGLMVKAGLIGWWRFLPLGDAALPEPGFILIILGLAAAFLGAYWGFKQCNIKALLAYSTISQMGIVTTGVGVALLEPTIWPLLSTALLIYAVHHGFAKAALFLSVGLGPILAPNSQLRWLAWPAIIIPTLAMVGFPFTSGAFAKYALKTSIEEFTWLALVLPFTAIGTTLLMLRYLELFWQSNQSASKTSEVFNLRLFAYFITVLLVLIFTYSMPLSTNFKYYVSNISALATTLWPIAAGILLYFVANRWPTKGLQKPLPIQNFFTVKVLNNSLSQCLNLVIPQLNSIKQKLNSNFHQLNKTIDKEKLRPQIITVSSTHPGVVFLGILLFLSIALALG